jgi:hypothetical protein
MASELRGVVATTTPKHAVLLIKSLLFIVFSSKCRVLRLEKLEV